MFIITIILCLIKCTDIFGYININQNHFISIQWKLQNNNNNLGDKAKITLLNTYDKYEYRNNIMLIDKIICEKRYNKYINKKLKDEHEKEAREELRKELREELRKEANDGLREELREELRKEANDGLREEVKKNKNKLYKWYVPYWEYINKELSENAKKIFKLKYSNKFDVIRSNIEIASILNCSEHEVKKNIIDSSDLISKKITFNYKIGHDSFIYKTLH